MAASSAGGVAATMTRLHRTREETRESGSETETDWIGLDEKKRWAEEGGEEEGGDDDEREEEETHYCVGMTNDGNGGMEEANYVGCCCCRKNAGKNVAKRQRRISGCVVGETRSGIAL